MTGAGNGHPAEKDQTSALTFTATRVSSAPLPARQKRESTKTEKAKPPQLPTCKMKLSPKPEPGQEPRKGAKLSPKHSGGLHFREPHAPQSRTARKSLGRVQRGPGTFWPQAVATEAGGMSPRPRIPR